MFFQGTERQGPMFNKAIFALTTFAWYNCSTEDALHLFHSDTFEGPIVCLFIPDYTVVGCNLKKYELFENNH